MKPKIRSLVAGLLWGSPFAIIWGLHEPWYYPIGALIAGSVIGLLVYGASKWSYRSIWAVAVWTVPSVYIATVLFGLVAGFLENSTPARVHEPAINVIIMFLLGVYHIPRLWFIVFPLAFVTHLWVRKSSLLPSRGISV